LAGLTSAGPAGISDPPGNKKEEGGAAPVQQPKNGWLCDNQLPQAQCAAKEEGTHAEGCAEHAGKLPLSTTVDPVARIKVLLGPGVTAARSANSKNASA
jgi:hypothetical protein